MNNKKSIQSTKDHYNKELFTKIFNERILDYRNKCEEISSLLKELSTRSIFLKKENAKLSVKVTEINNNMDSDYILYKEEKLTSNILSNKLLLSEVAGLTFKHKKELEFYKMEINRLTYEQKKFKYYISLD